MKRPYRLPADPGPLAELVATGVPVMIAGHMLGLTKGQTSRRWQNIKNDLGEQAR